MRFRIGSVPVQVQPSFFIVTAMLGWGRDTTGVAIWVAVCFVSILVHEMGHALVIARLGGTPQIVMHAAGGSTYGNKRETPGRTILVSLAGPGAGFVLAGVFFALALLRPPEGAIQQVVYGDLMWINVTWGLVNLIPMLPLDGGNAFQALLALRWPARARAVAELVSASCYAAAVVAALVMHRVVLAVMALYWGRPVLLAAQRRFDGLRDRAVAGRLDEVTSLRRAPRTQEAFDLARALLGQARTSTYRRALAAELVLLHLDRGEPASIEPLIARFQGAPVPQSVYLAHLLAHDGAEKAIDRIEQAVAAGDSPDDLGLFLDACAALGERDRAAALLGKRSDREAASAVVRQRVTVHFQAGRFDESLTLCEAGLLAFNDSWYAYNAACCLARLGRIDEGLSALQRAGELTPGVYNDALDRDADLAALRGDSRWPAVRAALLGS